MSLSHGDLKNVVLPDISVDEYMPNAGNKEEVIVVAFHTNDENPANDLNTFIQRGFVDVIDSEISPNTDEHGRFLVFVEMKRDKNFPDNFKLLLKDVKNLVGNIEWKIKTYLSDERLFSINDEDLFNYITLDPKGYMTKSEFKSQNTTDVIKEFFKNSLASNLTITDRHVTISKSKNTIIAEVVDVGAYDDVIKRNFLTESAFKLDFMPHEARVLSEILGTYDVLPIGKFLCINDRDNILLLKNTEIKYKDK